MSLIQIDPIGWLPDSLKQQIIDSVVTFVAGQAEETLLGKLPAPVHGGVPCKTPLAVRSPSVLA
jgi:hypothetical protein